MARITKHAIPRQGLSAPVNVPLPPRARVLSAAIEGVKPVVYVLGEGEPTQPRWFQLLWTLDRWPDGASYIGTVKLQGSEGEAVAWHVIELAEGPE